MVSVEMLDSFWRKATLQQGSSIKDAISSLNKSGLKIVLVIDSNQKFIGTISDGDIRRTLLNGMSIEQSIDQVVNHKPLIAAPNTDSEKIKSLMISKKIQQIPVIDKNDLVVGLHLWDEIDQSPLRDNIVIIMAGGRGSRLLPLTKDKPKPLIEVGGYPILQHLVMRAKTAGFYKFVIAIHHLGSQIEDHFGDGEKLGVEITYLREESPLGTAGALSLLQPTPELPFIVANGDVITEMPYGKLMDFHTLNSGIATIATKTFEWENPYGVITSENHKLISYQEKPVTRVQINAGIYVLSPESLKSLEYAEYCDMPTLLNRLLGIKQSIQVFPTDEIWFDVGNPQDLDSAKMKFGDGKS